ncbi:hypothetical protein BHE74_00039818 [Ensete ventricosum]|uniref:Uncharacterized protein n=1 Tax=Ensete ventricosum TaxID=4639 RepID=A0A444EG03_ENSVE|nr:hypothetical protein B296_00003354 [Ensete ventricosum]RWW09244.1 hypothetical protein GW17_00027277 [Ensete ventricosum]RWW53674.1 hypothetical protein BHE74_00039818 [Ensete ventricosum]RZR83150.1 hypothetical protein BHM03_00009706 [Ensete ventricosum]
MLFTLLSPLEIHSENSSDVTSDSPSSSSEDSTTVLLVILLIAAVLLVLWERTLVWLGVIGTRGTDRASSSDEDTSRLLTLRRLVVAVLPDCGAGVGGITVEVSMFRLPSNPSFPEHDDHGHISTC